MSQKTNSNFPKNEVTQAFGNSKQASSGVYLYVALLYGEFPYVKQTYLQIILNNRDCIEQSCKVVI